MVIDGQHTGMTLWPDSTGNVATTATLEPAATSRWYAHAQLKAAKCVPEEESGAYDILEQYEHKPLRQVAIDRSYFKMEQDEIDARIWDLKRELGDRLTILGHHYQRDEVVKFADFQGDSFKLSQQAAQQSSEYTLFCGVHFMAESANILGRPNTHVMLPNLEAGCSMADMAKPDDVEQAWQALANLGIEGVIPVTYMNSAATLKAFCGRNGGIVCTSSNASRVFDWAFSRGERIMFFPDEHLGRNSAHHHGIPDDKMVVWNPFEPLGGNTEEQLRNAQIYLWRGFCSVHTRFSVEQIEDARIEYPGINIIVHPECRAEVVQAADYNGSTERIINVVTDSPSGSVWGIGTEINLVRRLQSRMPDKVIFCLDPVVCPCSTMYRIHPAYMLWVLENLVEGKVVNEISVPPRIRAEARIALERMLAVP